MDRMMVRCWIVMLLAGVVLTINAAPPTIGVATARGTFRIDEASVSGNATLLEGAVLETSSTPSLVDLQNGSRMHLAATSRARFYGDRLVLERGDGQLERSTGYKIEANSLQIEPASSGSTTRVALRPRGRVSVEALAGPVSVKTGEGVLLAKLEPGTALEFAPQGAGATPSVSVSGCLIGSMSRFLLNDETAKVTFELRGQDLNKYAGQRVAITAVVLRDERPGQGATQVIQVMNVKVLSGGCPAAGTNAPRAKTGGLSTTSKAVIAGVAIASVAGGTALGLTGDEKSTISR